MGKRERGDFISRGFGATYLVGGGGLGSEGVGKGEWRGVWVMDCILFLGFFFSGFFGLLWRRRKGSREGFGMFHDGMSRELLMATDYFRGRVLDQRVGN